MSDRCSIDVARILAMTSALLPVAGPAEEPDKSGNGPAVPPVTLTQRVGQIALRVAAVKRFCQTRRHRVTPGRNHTTSTV
jgi:hypothetical protein